MDNVEKMRKGGAERREREIERVEDFQVLRD